MNDQRIEIEIDRVYEQWLIDTNLEDSSPKASFYAGMRAGMSLAADTLFKKASGDENSL